ncbi:MAG: extracellular solute-binding protein [Deltaproteobacteria bacterium]|nr:extracellular solute-binding protein [Deltaproteobacteria bacterium]
MKKLISLFAFLAVALSGFNEASGATIDDVQKTLRSMAPAQRRAALEEGAKKEGEVSWYTTMSLTDFPKIVGAFEKAYPGVKLRANRLSQTSILNKIDTEARAGRYAVDIVSASPIEMWELKQKGYSTPYLSPELKAFPTGAYDPQGFWISYEVTPIVLAFNTKMVSQDEAPKSYQDLLLPKWRGKMNFGTDEYAFFSVILDGMGKAKGNEFMRGLAKQQLHMPGSSSIMRVQLMLGGESAIVLAARARRVTELKEKNAPIDYRILEPYGAEPSALAFMRRGNHPYSTILFTDWMLSEEGQTLLAQQIPRLTLRKGIKQIPRHQELYKKDFAFVNPASIGPNLKELMASYQEIFNVR